MGRHGGELLAGHSGGGAPVGHVYGVDAGEGEGAGGFFQGDQGDFGARGEALAMGNTFVNIFFL